MKTKKGFGILVVILAMIIFLFAQVLIRKEVEITGIIVLADKDFELNIPQAASVELHRGESFVYEIMAVYLNGFDSEIMLSTENVPEGVTVEFEKNPLSFSNDPVTGESNTKCDMTVTIGVSVPIGANISFVVIGSEVE